MTFAQVIQGTGDELMAYLRNHREQRNLMLIIPEEIATDGEPNRYPEGAVMRQGAPLFPTEGRTEIVTLERVQQLME